MRARVSKFVITLSVAAVLIGIGMCCRGGRAAPFRLADTRPNAVAVDVELVLAVDVSYSMDPDEQALQREGYVTGITSREFLQALQQGMNGKVALTYVEWAGPTDQKILVPWRLIDGPQTAAAVAKEISSAPYRRAARTSISGALSSPSRCSIRAATAASAASSTSRATAPTTAASGSCRCATRCSKPASPSTACRSFSSGPPRLHRYRQSRRLLRGLRDRRPRLPS